MAAQPQVALPRGGRIAALVAQARAGDSHAQARLTEHAYPLVLARVRRQYRHPELAEDAVQEAFVVALTDLERLRAPERFVSWVTSIAMHQAADEAKARRDVAFDPTAMDLLDPSSTPDEVVESHAHSREVSDVLHAVLPEREADGLLLRDGHGVAIPTLSAMFGVSDNHMSVLLSHARRAARGALEGLLGLIAFLRLLGRRSPQSAAMVAAGMVMAFTGLLFPELGQRDSVPALGEVTATPWIDTTATWAPYVDGDATVGGTGSGTADDGLLEDENVAPVPTGDVLWRDPEAFPSWLVVEVQTSATGSVKVTTDQVPGTEDTPADGGQQVRVAPEESTAAVRPPTP